MPDDVSPSAPCLSGLGGPGAESAWPRLSRGFGTEGEEGPGHVNLMVGLAGALGTKSGEEKSRSDFM